MGTVTLKLVRETLTNVDDAAGRWQFEGGKVLKGATHVGHYGITRRVINGGTQAQNTAMVTGTLFFLKERPPQNITFQGAHNFNNGRAIGSVSAASAKYAWAHDALFTTDAGAGTIQIDWLGADGLTLP